MPEIQEVFRMATQKVRPDPEALDRQHRGQRRRVAQKRAAVYALVALLLVAGAVIGISTLGGDDVQPAGSGSNPPPLQAGEQTLSIVDVGTGTATAFTAPSEASGFDFTLDGSMITFAGQDDHGNTQVFVADADGSNARQLTHGEGGRSWSPLVSRRLDDRLRTGYVGRQSDLRRRCLGRYVDSGHQRSGRSGRSRWLDTGRRLDPLLDLQRIRRSILCPSPSTSRRGGRADRSGRKHAHAVSRRCVDRLQLLVEGATGAADPRQRRRIGAAHHRPIHLG